MTERVKVLTMVERIGLYGGAERLAVQIASGLDPERFESWLCATRWDAAEREDPAGVAARENLEAAGVRFIGLDRSATAQVWKWGPLLRLLRRERIDVVHAHMFGSNVWATVLGRIARVPVIVAHEHTWSFEGRPVRKLLDRELIGRGCSVFLAVSREDRRRMIEIEGVDPGKVRYLPNGADVPPASGSPAAVREELGVAPDAPLIGSVGHLRPQKAFPVLVEAAALLRERVPEVIVVIAGEGPERERLEALIAARRLQSTVRLLGRRLDVPDLLAALDVAVCSSDFEGSPVSIMEYMEAGLPVVSTAVGGVPDMVTDGVHGRLVAPGDPPALATAIAELLLDRPTARRLGTAGRERRRAEFTLSVMVSRLGHLYLELLGHASRQPEADGSIGEP